MSQLAGFGEFQALFDQYKITRVKWSLIPRGNSSDITNGVATDAGSSVGVFSVLDYDDPAPLTSIGEACEYANMKMTRSTGTHTRTLKPKANMMMLTTTGASVPSGTGYGGWLDTSYSNIPHYGIKFVLQQAPSQNQQFDLKIDYSIALKNVR